MNSSSSLSSWSFCGGEELKGVRALVLRDVWDVVACLDLNLGGETDIALLRVRRVRGEEATSSLSGIISGGDCA